ncbi:O-succinylbenzoate synthase [Leifsonia sp. Root227]|uniref:o-succinylbenzoate synthase n=1 Tax=Leifsonia sp. Root227 TaxID=1736496 RepID=UPI0006F6006F|nr:o-succinylbenzoate synthase [Leifsonia sp. Root227]KRC51539.1 O-succinylbenzoate synthase [Leifsonia sp. Root227]
MLPELADLLKTARVVALPMTSKFRGITVREAVLFEGQEGWTEFSPFVEYDDAESARWLHAAIDFGWRAVPTPLRDRIPVNATVPAVAADAVAAILDRYPGARTAKVKVAEPGQTLADDIARVRAVRDHLGPEGRIRIDANTFWNVDEAEHAIHALAPFDLEYVEQPCASIEELAEIRRRTAYMDVPIAADESVRKASDPLAVARADAADLLIVKAQPLGGIHSALRIVAEAGLPVVVSSAIDTSVGIAMGAHLAAAVPRLDFDCGLGTAAMFVNDVTDEPLRPVDGSIPVLRPSVSSARLDALAADGDRRDWWLDRIRRCYRLVERATAL